MWGLGLFAFATSARGRWNWRFARFFHWLGTQGDWSENGKLCIANKLFLKKRRSYGKTLLAQVYFCWSSWPPSLVEQESLSIASLWSFCTFLYLSAKLLNIIYCIDWEMCSALLTATGPWYAPWFACFLPPAKCCLISVCHCSTNVTHLVAVDKMLVKRGHAAVCDDVLRSVCRGVIREDFASAAFHLYHPLLGGIHVAGPLLGASLVSVLRVVRKYLLQHRALERICCTATSGWLAWPILSSAAM